MFGNRSRSFPLFNNYFFLQIEGLALYRVENFTTIIVEKISQWINGDLKSKSKCFRSGIFKIVHLQTSQTLDNSESSQELTFFFKFPNSFLDSRIVNLGVVRLWYIYGNRETRTSFCRV